MKRRPRRAPGAVAARASWCRPRPSCTRIRSARMDGGVAACRPGVRVEGRQHGLGARQITVRAARGRPGRGRGGEPTSGHPTRRARCPRRAAGHRCPDVPCGPRSWRPGRAGCRGCGRPVGGSAPPADRRGRCVGCSSATICARRPSRRARWRSPLRLVAISAARTCSASIPRPASRSWSAAANSRCRRCSASVAMSSAGSVPALKGDSDNGVLPGCYQARRKAVLRPSLAMATGTGDQIDEPTRLRRMAPTVRDSTCGNGAIT